MVTKPLPEHSVELGAKIVEVTDDLGLRAEGAFWSFDAATENWRFYLVTSLIDSAGPRFLFARLNRTLPKALATVSAQEAHSIYLASPREVTIDGIRKRLKHHREDWGITRPAVIDFAGGVQNVVIYRMTEPEPQQSVRWTRQRFRKKARELSVA